MSTLIGDLLLRIKGDSAGGEQALQQTKGGLSGIISPANMVKGALMAGGVAATAMAGKVRPLNEANSRLATVTGLSEQAVRDLTLELTDATFPIEDVQSGMDALISRGIDTEEQFRDLLPVFDSFSDATGKDMAESVRIADEVLSAFGIPLEEAGEHIDILTHVTERTDIPLSTLQRNLGRVPDELDAMNIELDDSIAYIEAFRDRGYTGQEAVREFRRAVEEADGDMEKFKDITGFTNEEMEKYAARVAESEGLTGELAEQVRVGPWEQFQQRLSEITFQYGEQIEAIGQYGFLLTGAIPLIGKAGGAMRTMAGTIRTRLIPGLVAAAKSTVSYAAIKLKSLVPAIIGATTAAWSFTAALLANPITWIVVLIIGLVAAIWYLWRNWDDVSEWLVNSWEWIRDTAKAIWGAILEFFTNIWTSIRDIGGGRAGELFDRIRAVFEAIFDFIKSIWNAIVDFYSEIWQAIRALFRGDLEAVGQHLRNAYGGMFDFIRNIWGNILSFFGNIWGNINSTISNALSNAWSNLRTWGSNMLSTARSSINNVLNTIRNIINRLPQILLDAGRRAIQSLARGIRNAIGSVTSAARSAVQAVRNLLPFSPAKEGPLADEPDFAGYLADSIEGGEAQAALEKALNVEPQVTAASRQRVTDKKEIVLDLRNQPAGMDKDNFLRQVVQALRQPEVMEELDVANYKNLQIAKRTGRV